MPKGSYKLRRQLQAAVLRRRGLGRGKFGKLTEPTIKSDIPAEKKTLAMRLMEQRFSLPIETLLDVDAPLKVVARRLGIAVPTVSVWRSRLGLTGSSNGATAVREHKS